MNKKRIMQIVALVVVLSMMFTTAAFATPGNKQFKRGEENYNDAVNYLIQKEIMKGYGKGDYGLNGNVKRGDVIVMIVRAFGLEDHVNVGELSEYFLDAADKDEYFYGPVAIAKKLGIAKGDGLYFKPNKPVTVQEAIWLIDRAEDLVGKRLKTKKVDLEDLFEEDELNNFAKRKDIALMLHYVLAGEIEDSNKENEIDTVEYAIKENKNLKLTSAENNFDDEFADVLKDVDSDIDYVKFDFSEDNGKLYYNYVARDPEKTLVSEDIKYYLEETTDEKEVYNITFVPDKNFEGIFEINYEAYVDDDVEYKGLIKITVGDVEEIDDILADMKVTMKENTLHYFLEEDFKDYIDEVTFVLPDEEYGTLYNDDDHDGIPENDEKLVEDGDLGTSEEIDDEELDDIIFEPYEDFTGRFKIEYTAVDESKTYSGEINVVVQRVQFENMEANIDDVDSNDDVSIDFDYELEDLADSINTDLYEKFDYVKFEHPAKGTLLIYINGTEYEIDDENDEIKYEIDDNDEITITYEAKSDYEGIMFINYTVYDSSKEYDGVIKITVEN